MAKKDSRKQDKNDLIKDDADLISRVESMMEIDSKVSSDSENHTEPATAPEIDGTPVMVQPEKETSQDNDNETQYQPTEPTSAPPLGKTNKDQLTKSTYVDQVEPEKTINVNEQLKVEAKDKSEAQSLAEPFEDEKTAEAVADIIRNESDAILRAEDDKLSVETKPQSNNGFFQKIRRQMADLWRNPMKRKMLIGFIVVLTIIATTLPVSRYFILNLFGVRASTSLRVLDESTLQPLKNVEISLNGKSTLTNNNGEATIQKIRLGKVKLKVSKRAFALVERQLTIGWGSNPLGEQNLKPTGTQYAFVITDYLSDAPLHKAEVISNDASAFSDEKGKALLTLDNPDDTIEVIIKSDGLRTENLKINADTNQEHKVRMVSERKHSYISRRDGRYDVYTSYVDGKDESLILAGTGSERDDIKLVPQPKLNIVALVSTRDNKRNQDGYLLSTLYIIDLSTKKKVEVANSERIQITDWFDERLVYVTTTSGASGINPKRSRLMAYNYHDQTNNELASADYFNDIIVADNRIYFAPSGALQKDSKARLFSIKADGSDKQTVFDKEVWNIFRTSYKHLALSVPGEWYDYNIQDKKIAKLSGEPAKLVSKDYKDSTDKTKSLWLDQRDGKGVLVLYSPKTDINKQLVVMNGLKAPVYWLDDDTIIYRVKSENETADYAISASGGKPHKITDVADTDRQDNWYYY